MEDSSSHCAICYKVLGRAISFSVIKGDDPSILVINNRNYVCIPDKGRLCQLCKKSVENLAKVILKEEELLSNLESTYNLIQKGVLTQRNIQESCYHCQSTDSTRKSHLQSQIHLRVRDKTTYSEPLLQALNPFKEQLHPITKTTWVCEACSTKIKNLFKCQAERSKLVQLLLSKGRCKEDLSSVRGADGPTGISPAKKRSKPVTVIPAPSPTPDAAQTSFDELTTNHNQPTAVTPTSDLSSMSTEQITPGTPCTSFNTSMNSSGISPTPSTPVRIWPEDSITPTTPNTGILSPREVKEICDNYKFILEAEFRMLTLNSPFVGGHQRKQKDATFSATDFQDMEKYLEEECPAITTFFPPKSSTEIGDKKNLMVAAIASMSRSRKCNNLQTALGVQLFSHLPKEQMEYLNGFGVVCSRKTAHRAADLSNARNWDLVMKWKNEYENELCQMIDEQQPSCSRRLNFEEPSVQSFILVLDNVDSLVKSRHQWKNKNVRMNHDSTGFFARSRVPAPLQLTQAIRNPTSLTASDFLLSPEETKLRFREVFRIFRNLGQTHLQCFQSVKVTDAELERRPHLDNISRKSQMIPTGISELPINSLKGTIEILDSFSTYFPRVDGEVSGMRVGGDGMTINLVEGSRILRSSSSKEGNFNGVWPSPSSTHFHRRLMFLKRIYKIFSLDRTQETIGGTLSNMRARCGFLSATTNVTETFNHGFELTELVMNGVGALLLMKHLRITTVDQIPEQIVGLDKSIVEMTLNEVATLAAEELLAAVCIANISSTKQCTICRDPKKKDLRTCDNLSCRTWIHSSCAPHKLQQNNERQPHLYFCSDLCGDRVYKYTLCLLFEAMKMVRQRTAIRKQLSESQLLLTKEQFLFCCQNRNTQYAKILFSDIAGQYGCVPAHIAHDEKYNSGINYREGHPDAHISMDKAQEDVVRVGKAVKAKQPSNASRGAGQRATQIGQAGDDLHKTLHSGTGKTSHRKHYQHREYHSETVEFVRDFQSLDLVVNVPRPRVHPGLEQFQYAVQPTSLQTLQSKVKVCAEDMLLTLQMCRQIDWPIVQFPNFMAPELPRRHANLSVSKHCCENPSLILLKSRFPRIHEPNDVQFQLASGLLDGRDVIASLPCGFGKSFVYILTGLLAEIQNPPVTVLIVSPLLSLIKVQMRMLESMDLSCHHLTHEAEKQIFDSIYPSGERNHTSFIFVTPEYITNRDVKNTILKIKPTFICFDEVHLILDWGNKFRTSFAELGRIRVFWNCPFLGLSATISEDAYSEIKRSLNIPRTCLTYLTQFHRPNTFYAIRELKRFPKFLKSLIEGVKRYGLNLPKTILFVDSYADLKKLYKAFYKSLGSQLFPSGKDSCLLQLYYSKQHEGTKEEIEKEFKKPESYIRIVIATSSFGLGIDIPDIKIVAHHQGQAEGGITQIVQNIGRCGRNGEQSIGLAFLKDCQYSRCHRGALQDKYRIPRQVHYAVPYTISETGSCSVSTPFGIQKCFCCEFCRAECTDSPYMTERDQDFCNQFLPSVDTGESDEIMEDGEEDIAELLPDF